MIPNFERQSNHEVISLLDPTRVTRHQSRAGYWFNENEPSWNLDKDIQVWVLAVTRRMEKRSSSGFVLTLSHYARTMSGSHTRNVCDRFLAMIVATKAQSVDTSMLINYRSQLVRGTEWKLGTIRGFIYKWHNLGYGGIDDEVIDLLGTR